MREHAILSELLAARVAPFQTQYPGGGRAVDCPDAHPHGRAGGCARQRYPLLHGLSGQNVLSHAAERA